MKEKMKRALALVLVLAMTLSLCPVVLADDLKTVDVYRTDKIVNTDDLAKELMTKLGFSPYSSKKENIKVGETGLNASTIELENNKTYSVTAKTKRTGSFNSVGSFTFHIAQGSKIAANAGEVSYYDGIKPVPTVKDVFDAIFDNTQSVPSGLTYESGLVKVQYYYDIMFIGSGWADISDDDIKDLNGKTVRISFAGGSVGGTEYAPSNSNEVTLTLKDPRSTLTINTVTGPVTAKWYEGRDVNQTLKDIFQAVYASSEPPISLDTAGVTLQYYNVGWREINEKSFSYMGSGKQVRIDFSGGVLSDGANYKPATSAEVSVKLDDTRTATRIIKTKDLPASLMLGADYEEELNEYFTVVYGNGEDIPVPNAKVTFGDKFSNITSATTVNKITAQFEGNDDFKPVSFADKFSISIEDAPHYNVTKNVTPNGSGTVNVKQVVGFSDGDPLGFTVTTSPSKGYYAYSIEVKNGDNTIVTAGVADIADNAFVVSAEALKGKVAVNDTLTVYVTFEQTSLTIDTAATAKYTEYLTVAEDNDKLAQFVVNAVHPVGTPERMTEGTPTVEYLVGVVTRTGRVTHETSVTEYWITPGADASIKHLDYLEKTTIGQTLYEVDEDNTWWDASFCPEVGTTETVRVSYSFNNDTVVSNTCALTIDGRIPTQINVSYSGFEELLSKLGLVGQKIIPVVYGKDLMEQLASRITVVSTDGESENPVVNAGELTVDPESVNVNLFQTQKVVVRYSGNNGYMACTSEDIIIYVFQQDADLDVHSAIVTYDGNEHKPTITAVPEDLDYFTLIVGIDGDATGFLSFDFPQSTKNAMRIRLTYKNDDESQSRLEFLQRFKEALTSLGNYTIDELMEKLAEDAAKVNIIIEKQDSEPQDWYLDIYKSLSEMSDNNMLDPENLETMINGLNELMENPLVKGFLKDFDLSSLTTALNIIKGINTITPKTKIILGKGPTNAGIYSVNAISSDMNYRLQLATGLLTILPSSENVALVFNQDLGNQKTTKGITIGDITIGDLTYGDPIPWDKAKDFNFGATLKKGDEEIPDSEKYVRCVYAGSPVLSLPEVGNEPIREPGTYYETIFVLGGNYHATNLVRRYEIDRIPVTIVVDESTLKATYSGDRNAVKATAVADDGMDLSDQLTFFYTAVKGDIHFSDTPPADAAVYNVTITFLGNSKYKPAVENVTLTVERADLSELTVTMENWVYGDPAKDPVLDGNVGKGKVTYTYYHAKYEDGQWVKDGDARKAKPTEAGEYIVEANVDATQNYNAGTASAHFTVEKKRIEKPMLVGGIFTYDGQKHSLSVSAASEWYTAEGEGSYTNAGSYTLTVSLKNKNNSCWADGSTEDLVAGLTINKAKLIVTADDKTMPSGSRLPEFTYTVSGLVNGETKEAVFASYEKPVFMTRTDGNTVGEFAIEKKAGADTLKNYNVEYRQGKLTVMYHDELTPILSMIQDESLYTRFVDVPFGAYYTDAINWALREGITEGVDYTHFAPDAFITRGQVVTFLWRAAGCPIVNYVMNMDDVSQSDYFAEAVRWALATGIAKGTSATTFSPNEICTRAHVVTFLARYAGVADSYAETVFTDVKPTDYFASAVQWAYYSGVTEGTSPTTFSPNDKCSRAQVVTFLYRYLAK